MECYFLSDAQFSYNKSHAMFGSHIITDYNGLTHPLQESRAETKKTKSSWTRGRGWARGVHGVEGAGGLGGLLRQILLRPNKWCLTGIQYNNGLVKST